MRNHIASTYPSSYKEERVWTWCSLIDKVLFTTFLFFTVGLIQAQAPCSTTGSNNFVGALPETEQDFIGPYFIRIFPQVVRLPGGGGSSPSDEAIIAALNQMSLDFAPHNIFFVWDCEIISIENENLYVYFPAQQCSLLYDNLYGHENGIDIFFGPGEGTSGFGSAAGIGSKTIVMNGATFGTSRWLSHEMGHCLGLWHTHHGTATEQGSECPGGAPADPEQCAELPSGANSSVCGDYIHYDPNPLISTPADPGMASNVDPNTCVWNGSVGSPYNPDERNIMAYSIPSCMQYFATLQGSRMRYTIANNATVQACLTSYDYSHVTVNQTETWTTSNTLNNGNVSIVEALIIESGATLTIENGVVVRFREQGKIIIKPNGRLILRGMLTSVGCFQTWQGVEVWGSAPQPNPNLSQYPIGGVYAQGRLTCELGAVIERAKTAAKLYGPDYSYAGGIINCKGTVFSNNIVGVEFAPYKNFWPYSFPSGQQGQPRNYAGSFSGCTFITDDDYRHEQEFDAFIKMVGVNGVSIAGGSFTNSKSTNGNDIADWGYGIWATDAGFRIVPACQLGSIPPVCQGTGFNGLGYGVYTSKLWENRPYTVQGANFTNCFMGHYNRLVIDGTVLQNTFNMGSLPDTEASNGIQIGAEFEGVINSFLVEENHFIKNTASENIITLGTVCYETGAFLRNIRLNDYTSLTVGNLANGLNRGIRYLCNTNQNASYTSFIPPWDFYVSEGGQINGNQGIPVPGFPITYQSAANTFSYAPGETGSDFTNSTNLVRYHYEVLAAFEKPEDVIGNFDDEVANQSNGCLPTYCTPPCPEPPPTPTPKNEFYAYQSAWHTSLQEYAANPTPEKAEVVAFHRAGMDEYGGKVIHAILLDTIAYHQDTLRQWLSNMETYETDLMLATDFYRTGQPAEGQQILNAATTKFGLNSEQQLDLGRYTTILNTLSGKSPYMLDSISLATISSYIESGGCVEALARNILAANGVHFPPKYILPEEVQERSNPVTIESRGVDSLLSVYPNPASDRVSFLLHFPPTASSIFLRVIDLNGKTVHLSSSLPPVGELVWPTQDLPNGIYFYHLIAVGIPPHSGSIIVHR